MIKVRVPATSANMGPGFDSLGIALSLYNIFNFDFIDSGIIFKGIPEEFCNDNNIIYKAMMKCFNKANYIPKGLIIEVVEQEVPISRGLGSSSSCIVGGLVGANYLMGNKFSKEEILQMAVEMEGHPDNVAPAVLGGMVVAIMDEDYAIFDKVRIREDLRFVSIIPDFKLDTMEARGILPKSLTMKQGIYNVSRVALMITSLYNGNYDLLKKACEDSFHEEYRSQLIRGFHEISEVVMEFGALATYLSGAGPTMMAIINGDEERFSNKLREFLNEKGYNYNIKVLTKDNLGATIIEGEGNEG